MKVTTLVAFIGHMERNHIELIDTTDSNGDKLDATWALDYQKYAEAFLAERTKNKAKKGPPNG